MIPRHVDGGPGSELAGRTFGIEDDGSNFTRLLLLGRSGVVQHLSSPSPTARGAAQVLPARHRHVQDQVASHERRQRGRGALRVRRVLLWPGRRLRRVLARPPPLPVMLPPQRPCVGAQQQRPERPASPEGAVQLLPRAGIAPGRIAARGARGRRGGSAQRGVRGDGRAGGPAAREAPERRHRGGEEARDRIHEVRRVRAAPVAAACETARRAVR